MARRFLTLALAAGTAIGIATFAHAQSGKSGTSGPGASDYAPGRSANPPPGQGGQPPGQTQRGTTGQGKGASEFAPGRSTTNPPPGQGGDPPGQMMNDQKSRQGGSGNRSHSNEDGCASKRCDPSTTDEARRLMEPGFFADYDRHAMRETKRQLS